jgi:hypothetical protein
MYCWSLAEYLDWVDQGCAVNKNVKSLEIIGVFGSRIKTLSEHIDSLPNISTLIISNNLIKILPPQIGNLKHLKTLNVSNNRLSNLPVEISKLIHLTTLDISNNNINDVPSEFFKLTNLINFNYTNEGKNIQHLIDIIYTNKLYFDANYDFYIDMMIALTDMERNVPEQDDFLRGDQPSPIDVGIYSNNQNVHDSTIQSSIKDSINRIMKKHRTMDPENVMKSIQSDSILTSLTKRLLIKFSENTDLISKCDVSFLDVLIAVWNCVVKNPYSNDIKNVLNEEMKDAKDKCFTGRVSRLLNCLSGYDDDVEVKISDSEQIGNVISSTEMNLRTEGKYTVARHKKRATNSLKMLGYTDDVISTWVNHIG